MAEIEVWNVNRHEHEAKPVRANCVRQTQGEPFVPKAAYDVAAGILADFILLSQRGEIKFHGSDASDLLDRAKALVFT